MDLGRGAQRQDAGAEAGRRGRSPGEIERHLFLIRAMARRHGVSLSQAMQEGILTRTDFAAMVDCCRACPDGAEVCAGRPDDHDTADAAPQDCANRAVLDGLRGLV